MILISIPARFHQSAPLTLPSQPKITPIMLPMAVGIIDNAAGAATTSLTKIWPNLC